MWAALVGVVLFFIFIMGAAMTMLWSLNRNSKRPVHLETPEEEIKEKPSKPTYRHISELINIEVVEPGIIYAGGKYLGYARIGGTNFSILSDGEQDIREDILIALQNEIKYPEQFVTSTVITDTDQAAKEVRDNAAKTENPKLASYNLMYATELEEMKKNRQAMAQVSWLVISDDGKRGNPGERIRDKISLLQEIFRARSGLILTPLKTTEEVIDALQQIMLPERLTQASETATLGLHPIKFNIKEIQNIA